MLPRIVLIALQIGIALLVGGWIAEPIIRAVGAGRDYGALVYAFVYAVIVWLVGLAGAGVLKGLRSPSAATFAVSVVLALVLAVLTLIPGLRETMTNIVSQQALPYVPLVGALAGYLVTR